MSFILHSHARTSSLQNWKLWIFFKKSGLCWLKWNRAIDPVAELQRSSNKAEIASMTRNVIAPSAAIAKRIVEKHIGSDCPLVLCELAACEACGEEIKAFCVKQK